MRVLIQHNIRAGLGDFTNGMRRYFHFAERIKKRKFSKISLYVNMKESIMFDKDFFFKLYNKSLLEIAENGKSGKRYNIGSKIDRDNLEMIVGNLYYLQN
jgi:dTDP-D-glucose 4,6-dehydratase